MTTLILTGILTTASTSQAEELKLVEESVDEICVIQPASANYQRAFFFRDGKYIADRIWQEDMVLSQHGDCFVLTWQDYMTAHRVVTAKKYSIWTVGRDFMVDDTVLWWMALRNMNDLRAP